MKWNRNVKRHNKALSYNLVLIFYLHLFIVCGGLYVCEHHGLDTERREQLMGVCSLFLPLPTYSSSSSSCKLQFSEIVSLSLPRILHYVRPANCTFCLSPCPPDDPTPVPLVSVYFSKTQIQKGLDLLFKIL